MKGVLIEKWEGYREELTTLHGILSFLVSNLIEGFVIVTYVQEIFAYILSIMPFSGFLQTYLSYIAFSLFGTVLYLIILWFLMGIFKAIGFKDKKIF